MRLPLFCPEVPESLKFYSDPKSKARFKVLCDVEKFSNYSKQALKNYTRIDDIIEKTISYFLLEQPKIKSGRDLYSCRKQIEYDNGRNDKKLTELEAKERQQEIQKWIDHYVMFRNQIAQSFGWVRLGRACRELIDNPNSSSLVVSAKWEVSNSEVQQILNWYYDRGQKLYGSVIPYPAWYSKDVCDEEQRFVELFPQLRNHASRKLASPKFSYLKDLYEDQNELIYMLLDRAWVAILYTAHKPSVESLKLAKDYISTEIHHVAHEMTSSNKKQVYNPTTKIYEIQELQLTDNPDMDESKHEFLKFVDENFETSELKHTLDAYLNPSESELVYVLSGWVENKEFEDFAATQPDRRMAAYAYFKVQEQQLKEFLPRLLHGELD